jgi:NRAMP (natural resistance-associated macrophage protein)-like metal ion transporter
MGMEKSEKKETKVQRYWNMLGPGLTTGAADDDPSGIATYSQAGASFGYGFLWTALFTFPFMAVIQEMCARIGIVTGRGLASAIRKHYSEQILYVAAILLLVANTFNLGADLGIMAKAVQLLWPNVSFTLMLLLFTIVSLLMQIYTSYAEYARILKWVALVLFSYVATAFVIHINWSQALHSTFVPNLHFDKPTLIILTAVLGTTISPYLFFWQTSQEVEEQILEGKTHGQTANGSHDHV